MEELKEKQIVFKAKRIVYYDILNILAILAVIAMHCNGIVHGNPTTRSWNTSLLVDCICYWAVPVFLMLSGATLMEYRKKYDTKTFFKKRFLKVLIPFTFWAVTLVAWKVYVKQFQIKEVINIKRLINIILNNEEEFTYYFMFDILGIYLTMPLLSLLTENNHRKTLWYTVLVYFIFNATLSNILPLIGIKYNNSLTIQLGGYVVYVLLGYLLSTQDLNKKQKILLYCTAILGLLFRYITTFIWSKQSGEVIRYTWGYCQWHTILLASAVFVFVKNIKIIEKIKNNKKICNAIKEIANCSFGIYLIHKIIMYYEVLLFNINVASWKWRVLGIVTTYIFSLTIVYILKKIPILKRLVP